MSIARCAPVGRAWWIVLLVVSTARAAEPDPLTSFALPDAWEATFWADPGTRAVLALDPKAAADLVPVQAGLRYCRCPNCAATEAHNPLSWSAARPKVLTCQRCGAQWPKEKKPSKEEKDKEKAKDKEDKEKKPPEESIEVLPRVTHHYPYLEVEAEKQLYPDERLYLEARRDYEAREFLAKFALYAAVRWREQPARAGDPRLARLACTLLVRFAQVYPAYALHYDQPGEPKYFQEANLPPPYRRGFRTGKWDWSGSLDVPLNLVIAYALLRHEPALSEAGRLLGDPNPARTIEHDLFRASAGFVRAQPDDFTELSLPAYRGLLAVGTLLHDPELIGEARRRLAEFTERGFYHDGLWRQGSRESQRRVLEELDGGIGRFFRPSGESVTRTEFVPAGTGTETTGSGLSILDLARQADSVFLNDPTRPDIHPATWPALRVAATPHRPMLLGGAGVARLAVGPEKSSLDLELRAQDSYAVPRFQRLALRVAVGGRAVLSDLDDLEPVPSGWDRATASHNTVLVDGLNQRESPAQARRPAPGGNVLFFAADPDFQVVTLDDPHAYPQSVTRYRHTAIAVGSGASRYAASVFEVHGGLQHDQLWHGAPGFAARWQLGSPLEPGPGRLLSDAITFLPTARADDGRWFVQALGELTPVGQARLEQPSQAVLMSPAGPGVRLHLLNSAPVTAILAEGPDPISSRTPRATLVLRRRSRDGSSLRSTFVTLIEPREAGLKRVGRVASPEGTVVLLVETAEGPEHLVVNLTPGTTRTLVLGDGSHLKTDGLAVRMSAASLVLAGGTFAECRGYQVGQARVSGRIARSVRQPDGETRGWFETEQPIPDAAQLAGRTLLIRHGDGSTHGWTLRRVDNGPNGARLAVVEEPGFQIESATGAARYYQFPRTSAPGPHEFGISRIARATTLSTGREGTANREPSVGSR